MFYYLKEFNDEYYEIIELIQLFNERKYIKLEKELKMKI